LWQNWCNYCSTHSLGIWSCTPSDLLGYLNSVYRRNRSVSSAYQNLSSIAYFYRLRGLVSPTVDPIVTMFMKSLKRRALENNPGVRRARPMTKDILTTLNTFLFSAYRTLRQWRTIWRINLAFYCLLRWDDVCRLKVSFFV